MKKIVLTPNPYRDKNFKYVTLAEKILREAGMDTRICLAFDVDKNFALPQNVPCYDMEEELEDADLLVCFGGDGTILHASKAATRAGIPVLGVNIGTVGFMAELEGGELKQLRRLAENDYSIEERIMLQVAAEHEGKQIFDAVALNDAVIAKGAVARTVQMEVFCDDAQMMDFSGDGLVVCTPTGSTAYSMSAGGPIVEPCADTIIVTPICAHDMRTKAIITSSARTITVNIGRIGRKNAFLCVDGGRGLRLSAGDRITVRKSAHTTKLVRLANRSFFEVVNNKLK
ncbi:MAG: NAD(+)/NADH kinase [Oscillospiraceae bacterium]|jgi:NAD+ kinase|nr:NAD(+)/NADH kinase [Oscillospiraceae bacterium]